LSAAPVAGDFVRDIAPSLFSECAAWAPWEMTSHAEELIRARQKSRSLVMALILGGLAVLFFAITIAKIQAGHA